MPVSNLIANIKRTKNDAQKLEKKLLWEVKVPAYETDMKLWKDYRSHLNNIISQVPPFLKEQVEAAINEKEDEKLTIERGTSS